MPSTTDRHRSGRPRPAAAASSRRPGPGEVQQIVGDPEGDHDWRIVGTVDLDASDLEGELVLELASFKPL